MSPPTSTKCGEGALRIEVSLQHSIADSQHEEILQVVLFLIENRLKRIDRGLKVIGHEIAHALEVPRLDIGWVQGDDFGEGARGQFEFMLAEIGEAQVEADARRRWGESLGFFEHANGFVNFTQAQVDDTEIGIDGGGANAELKKAGKVLFGDSVLFLGKSLLPVRRSAPGHPVFGRAALGRTRRKERQGEQDEASSADLSGHGEEEILAQRSTRPRRYGAPWRKCFATKIE